MSVGSDLIVGGSSSSLLPLPLSPPPMSCLLACPPRYDAAWWPPTHQLTPPPKKKKTTNQVALYIDAARAAASPRLRPFAGMDRAALQANQSFYDAMMSPEVRVCAFLWVGRLDGFWGFFVGVAWWDGWVAGCGRIWTSSLF